MKVYLASRYSRKEEMRAKAEELRALGIEVTSSWLEEPHAANSTMNQVSDSELMEYASQDLDDVHRADWVVFFSEDPLVGTPRGGRHVEFGYALGIGTAILVVGPRENIFHHLPKIEVEPTWSGAVHFLQGMKDRMTMDAIDLMNQQKEKWDRRYLELAKFIAQWSKDPSTKTGAVIVDPSGYVAGVGYNGFPRRVNDTEERLTDRDLKYKLVVHCERNAIISAKRDLIGSTLYTYPFMSCAPCAGMVIQAGITRCVSYENDNPRWQEDFNLTRQMFWEAAVLLNLYKE